MTASVGPHGCPIFKAKRAVSVYMLIVDQASGGMAHREVLRAVNVNPKELYIFPGWALRNKSDFHFSYHHSGAFHWTINRSHEVPLYGKDDYSAALRTALAAQFRHGWITGFCTAYDFKRLSPEELKAILVVMVDYVPFELVFPRYVDAIIRQGAATFPNPRIDELKKNPVTAPLAFGVVLLNSEGKPDLFEIP